MLCSCGKQGAITTKRREIPYCEECFKAHIARTIRQEAGQGPVALQQREGYFLEAAKAACKEAKRDVIFESKGKIPGCAETAAAAKLAFMLGHTQEKEEHFPKTITLEELQMFFKAEQPILDRIAKELIEIEQRYPGTVNSINK